MAQGESRRQEGSAPPHLDRVRAAQPREVARDVLHEVLGQAADDGRRQRQRQLRGGRWEERLGIDEPGAPAAGGRPAQDVLRVVDGAANVVARACGAHAKGRVPVSLQAPTHLPLAHVGLPHAS